MCGLVAVLTKNQNGFNLRETAVFSEMLFADTVRGDDATGCMKVDAMGNLLMIKEATYAPLFQTTVEYGGMMSEAIRDGAALIGHNRKATKGDSKLDENAHPFVVDNRICLVHNGTLWNDHKKFADVDVDSHAIAHLIHENGDDVAAALRQLHGAYALIWYDIKERSMNFIRNDQRPLWMVETASSWNFASEPGMMGWILNRNGQTATGKYTELEVGRLYKFTKEGRSWVHTSEMLDLTTKHEIDWDTYYGIRNNAACGYGPWDNNDPIDVQSRDILTPSQFKNAFEEAQKLQERARNPDTYVIKTRDGEEKRAVKGGMLMDSKRFCDMAAKYQAGQWVTGTVFDYDIIENDKGFFLYATVNSDVDLMIRCFVARDTAMSFEEQEKVMLRKAAEEKHYAFKIVTRGWHKCTEGDVADGWGCIYSTEHNTVRQVLDVLDTEDYAG